MNDLVPSGQNESVLALPDADKMLVLFQTENGFDPLIDQLKAQARAEASAHDPETAKGREAIKAIAYKVSKTRAEIERRGLAATETLRAQVAAANAGKSTAMQALADLRDEIRRPAIEVEQREEARIAAHKDRLELLKHPESLADLSSAQIDAQIDRIEAISLADGWEEFQAEAAIAKDSALTALRSALATSVKREAEARELEELRAQKLAAEEAEAKRKAEEEEREADRQREIAKAAELDANAAKAREYIAQLGTATDKALPVLIHLLEEELVPRIDALGRHAEAIHQLRLATLENVRQRAVIAEREQAEARDKERREAEEKARRDAEDLARRQAAEREAAHQRELEAARKREEEAAAAERQRLADLEAEAEAARVKREKDKRHRARIRDDIATSLNGFCDELTAGLIADAIMADQIGHVKAII